jgi:pilus assembly protein CpaB
MKGKSVALLILALGCGLVASLGITQVLAKRGDQAAPADTAPIFVAKIDIPQGMMAGADFLKLEQWPKDKIPAGALTRQEEVDNRRARYTIFAGQPILEPMLLHAGEMPVGAQIPKGMRVVAIPVGIEAVVGGLVVPGARCDVQVFMRQDPGLGIGETVAKTVLQDIKVFAVNDMTNMQQQQQGADPKAPESHSVTSAKTVSLLVTPAQASVVTLASQLGTIRLILRSGDDSVQTKDDPLSARKLLGGIVGNNRPIENPDREDDGFGAWFRNVKKKLASTGTTKQSPGQHEELAPDTFTMRMRTADTFNDVILTANVGPNGQHAGDDAAWTATNLPAPSKSAPDTHVPVSTNVAPVAAPSGGTAAKQQNDAPSPTLKVNAKPPLGS